MNNKDFYVKILTNNLCAVDVNSSGGFQTLYVTLSNDFITKHGLKPPKNIPNTQYSFPVVDTINKRWIPLVVSSIQNCRLSVESVSPLANVKSTRATKSDYAGLIPTPDVTQSANLKRRGIYINYLRNNVCSINFKKVDGSVRTMKATLLKEALTRFNLTPTNSTLNENKDLDIVRVIDIDCGEWRSFRLSRLITFNIDNISIDQYLTSQPIKRNAVLDEVTMNSIIRFFSNHTITRWTEREIILALDANWPGISPLITPITIQPLLVFDKHDIIQYLKDQKRILFPIVTEQEVFPRGWSIPLIKEALNKNICEVVFKKADGSVRTMTATTKSDFINTHNLQPSGIGASSSDPDLIRAIDTDIKEWRSFRFSKVQSFKVLDSKKVRGSKFK